MHVYSKVGTPAGGPGDVEVEGSMNRVTAILMLLLALSLIGFAYFQRAARVDAEQTLGLDAARVIEGSFESAADLKVGTLSGRIVVNSEYHGTLFSPTETKSVPFSVGYFVDLSRIGARSYRWDTKSKTLTVDIPDITIGQPNIDETAAVTKQEGVFISRNAGLALARQASERVALRAGVAAREPKRLDQARANARAVIARMAREPLAAAGIQSVHVAISFPWEPKSGPLLKDEQWDKSRSLEDVLDDSNNAG